MKHATQCKFCKKPIVVTIDDEYGSLGDPLKLLPLAACNRCADLRVRRRVLEEGIRRAVLPLLCASKDKLQAIQAKSREELIPLTKKYCAMVADWVGSKMPAWDAQIVDGIIEQPQNTHKFLSATWRMYE